MIQRIIFATLEVDIMKSKETFLFVNQTILLRGWSAILTLYGGGRDDTPGQRSVAPTPVDKVTVQRNRRSPYNYPLAAEWDSSGVLITNDTIATPRSLSACKLGAD
jgi:hypothetical protein